MKQNCKKLYVSNLNPNVTEEDINELFDSNLRRTCIKIVGSKWPLIEIPESQKDLHF